MVELGKRDNPWKTLNSKIVHDTPWVKISHHEVINPGGKPGEYSITHFKNTAIGIIALDNDYNTWIVGQFRYPINLYSWEIPEGGGKLTIPPLDSAKRELLEETGIKAEKWTKILEIHLSNSATDEFGVIYVAQNLTFHEPEPEEDEDLEIVKIPFTELFELVMNGKITDSLTIAGVMKAKLLMDRNEL